jgi:hypothetical protein
MTSTAPIGYTDGDYAERASIVAEFAAAQASIAAAQAAAVRALAKAAAHAERVTRSKAARERDMALRSIAAEIACATRMSDRTVQRRIGDAESWVTRYPETMAAWADGRISQGHVRAVADAGLPQDAEDQALFDQAAVPVCEAQTPAGAKHLLEMLAEKLNPRTLTERHQQARDTRSVRVAPLPDGMAELIVILPLTLAHAIHDRLTQQGRAVKNIRERARRDLAEMDRTDAGRDPATTDGGTDSADRAADATGGAVTEELDAHSRAHAEMIASDDRTLDHLRADILADMLLTGSPDADPTVTGDKPGELGAIRAHVQVIVPVLVAAGVSDDPADLVGRGPVDADTARRLVGQPSGFDRVLTHPVTGAVLAVDRYQTTAAIDRHLRARDQQCRFPGCRMPTTRCDIDHTRDHALGGETAVRNLAHLCKRHHTLKHATPWRVVQLPGGVLEWTSPLGHTYTDEPPAVGPSDTRGVRFIPDDDPPPF